MAITFTSSSSQYLQAASAYSTLQTTASITYWIRTTQVGNDLTWQAPAVFGVEEVGGVDDIFWGWLDNNSGSSRMGVTMGDDGAGAKSNQVNTGGLFHLAFTRNQSTGTTQAFVNGSFNAISSTPTGVVGNSFDRIANVVNGAYLDARLDDIRVYNRVLSANEISAIYACRGGDDVREGLVSRYMMDEQQPGFSAFSAASYDETGSNNTITVNYPAFAEHDVGRRRPA